jgi:predicted transcriptional regulator of viral defense system
MRYIELRSQFKPNDIIDIRNVINIFGNIDRRRLYEWQKRAYIKRIANNFYIFADAEISQSFLYALAGHIYRPSYVSLQSALAFYSFIPEAVFQVTCVTTRKTKTVNSPVGAFKYRSILPSLFWGYRLYKEERNSFFVAEPEKALLDYFYFNPALNSKFS